MELDDKLLSVATCVGNGICTWAFIWNPCYEAFFKPLFIERRLAEHTWSYSGTPCLTFIPYTHLHLRTAWGWMHSCSGLFSSGRLASVIFISAYLNLKSTVQSVSIWAVAHYVVLATYNQHSAFEMTQRLRLKYWLKLWISFDICQPGIYFNIQYILFNRLLYLSIWKRGHVVHPLYRSLPLKT